jgi:hypothetical protein
MHDLDARTVLRKLAETNDLSQQTAVLVAAAALDPGASYLVRFVNGLIPERLDDNLEFLNASIIAIAFF